MASRTLPVDILKMMMGGTAHHHFENIRSGDALDYIEMNAMLSKCIDGTRSDNPLAPAVEHFVVPESDCKSHLLTFEKTMGTAIAYGVSPFA